MKTARYKLHWNRKDKLNKEKKALVQLEIYLSPTQRKFISTGVYLKKNQWDKTHKIVKNHTNSVKLNKTIKDLVTKIENYEYELINSGRKFTFEKLDAFLKEDGPVTFLKFMKDKIEERTDLRESTKEQQRSSLKHLVEFGKIVDFKDLTYQNIEKFDAYLRTLTYGKEDDLKHFGQTHIHGIHKRIKTYVNLAVKYGYIKFEENPYFRFKVKKGTPREKTFLTLEELHKLIKKKMPVRRLEFEKDLFLFQCYTGIAYADLEKLQFDAIKEIDGEKFIIDKRQKTNSEFTTPLLPMAEEIIEKYKVPGKKYIFNVNTNQKRNAYLKEVAASAGIEKNLTTHAARHTFSVILINNEVAREVLQTALGHTSSKTTDTYISILKKTVKKEIARSFDKINDTFKE